jgi:hypothetical protein
MLLDIAVSHSLCDESLQVVSSKAVAFVMPCGTDTTSRS